MAAMLIKSALRDCLPALIVILSVSEESRYSKHMRQMLLNTGRREDCSMLFLGVIGYEQHYGELAACGGFSPLWCLTAPPFPRKSGGTTTRALLRVTYEITTSRSFIVPPLAGGRWWRSHQRGRRRQAAFILAPRRLPQPSWPQAMSNLRTFVRFAGVKPSPSA